MKNRLNIGWLYPNLMNTYGDKGNIINLRNRCIWRGIECNIKELNIDFKKEDILSLDFIFMGGAQDQQQQIVAKDIKDKIFYLKEKIEKNTPGLFICGAYQFMGIYYKTETANIKGLGIINAYTVSDTSKERIIGDIAIKTSLQIEDQVILGFENHGGRTYFDEEIKPLGKVIKGKGNNDNDKTEGAIYKNCICSYMHGPLLPINPSLTDYLIKKSLEVKYGEKIQLKKLDNSIEHKTRKAIATRLQVGL